MSTFDLGYVDHVSGCSMKELENKVTAVRLCLNCNRWEKTECSDLFYLHKMPVSVVYIDFTVSNNGTIEQRVRTNDANPGRLGCVCKR